MVPTRALDTLQKLAAELELDAELGHAETPDGKVKVVGLKHGSWTVVAIPRNRHILLLVEIELSAESGAALERLRPEERNKFFAIVTREMLDGRTGFNYRWKDEGARTHLVSVRLEQRIAMFSPDGPTAQRLLDGMQELVTLAVRTRNAFGLTFASLAARDMPGGSASSAQSGAPETMYL